MFDYLSHESDVQKKNFFAHVCKLLYSKQTHPSIRFVKQNKINNEQVVKDSFNLQTIYFVLNEKFIE